MQATLRNILSALIPSVFLVCLCFVMLGGATKPHILDFLGGTPLVLILTSWIGPKKRDLWSWLSSVPALALLATAGWLFFRLAPLGETNSAWLVMGVLALFFTGAWLIEIASRKWWPELPAALKVAFVAMGIIVTIGVAFYFLIATFGHYDWHDILVTNWDVTVLVLYFPLMILGYFGYRKWRSLKKHKS